MKLSLGILTLFVTVASVAQGPADVSFRLIDGWAIVLEGTLGGMPHQKVLIDTGAVPSAINIKLAKRLGLSGPIQELSLMNRVVAVTRVQVPDVRVGVVGGEALEMVAMDLERIERALGTRIDAVIGLDLLAKHNFRLDYRRKKMTFDSGTHAAQEIAFQTGHEAGGTYVLISLESGGEKLQLLLDTGIRDLMLFKRRLGGTLMQLQIRGQDAYINAGGNDSVAEVEMQSVHVGSISRRKQKAYVWSTPTRTLRIFNGLLGPAALGTKALAFDFNRHVVSFETR